MGRGDLRTALLAFVVLLGIGGGLTLAVTRWQAGVSVAQEGERLAGLAQVTSDRLEAGLRAWLGDVTLLASFEAFRRVSDIGSARQLLEDLKRRSPEFSWIGYTDARGRVLAATGRLLEGVDVSARPWFAEGRQGPHLGDVHPAVLLAQLLPVSDGGGAGAYFVDAAAPVHDDAGAVIGVIAGHMTWRWAESVRAQVLQTFPGSDRPDVTILAADGSVLLGGPTPSGARASFLPPPATRGWSEATPDGSPIILGWSRNADAASHPGLGWTVVASTGRDAALAGVHGLTWLLGATSLVLALAGAWLSNRSARRFGVLAGMLGHADVDAASAQLNRLRDQAWHDALTGLQNRAGFEAWRTRQGSRLGHCTVVALDLDGFKPINDTHGHAAGDQVLAAIGAWMTQSLRSGDAAVRLGGDEFLLVLPGPPGQTGDAARRVNDGLQAFLAAGIPTSAGRLSLGCSAGLIRIPEDAPDLDAAIRCADEALYAAKRGKRTPARA